MQRTENPGWVNYRLRVHRIASQSKMGNVGIVGTARIHDDSDCFDRALYDRKCANNEASPRDLNRNSYL